MYKQQMQMGGGGMNPMGAPDPKKAFEAERQAIEMVSLWSATGSARVASQTGVHASGRFVLHSAA